MVRSSVMELCRQLLVYQTSVGCTLVGPVNDGGYVVPNGVPFDSLVSFGVGGDWRFEDAFNEQYHPKLITAIDPAVGSKQFEGNPKTSLIEGHFGLFQGVFGFTLDSVTETHLPNVENVLLKMDVEASEYSGLYHSSLDSISKFAAICCELHAFEHLNKPGVYRLIFQVLHKLKFTHTIISLIPNNACPVYFYDGLPIPQLLEVTFLRNDYVTDRKILTGSINHYGHKNVTEKPAINWNPYQNLEF